MQDLKNIAIDALFTIKSTNTLNELENIRLEYLGKKGVITELLKKLKDLSVAERPKFGAEINQIKMEIQNALEEKKNFLENKKIAESISRDKIDVTLPGRDLNFGSLHPVSSACKRIENIFTSFGFQIASGPEIEDTYHNFTALNFPQHHPARAMQDTFYLDADHILRTHMSPVQIRYMQKHKPPMRIISPGRVYRNDFDVTHTPMFHQMEGLLVDENVSFANLKDLLINFLNAFFNKKLKVQMRPSYFPFTEPSAEIDIGCFLCDGADKECRICGGSGWLEVLGCGMVHPNVLRECQIDSEQYNGLAFGLGIDRLAMLYYGITDLRTLFENDVRFLQQF